MELKGTKIPILDKGFVQLVDYMGSDDLIVQAARVSYGGKKKNTDEKLIQYLVRNDHTSPLEMVEFVFLIKVPIFVARQIFRHRTASFNEISGRYTVYEEEFFLPEFIRKNLKANRQVSVGKDEIDDYTKQIISEHYKNSYELYSDLLQKGLAKELARVVLPLSTYTMFYYKQDLKNLLHFLKLRLHHSAQEEVRAVAKAIAYFVSQIVPITFDAFKRYKVKKIELTFEDVKECLEEFQKFVSEKIVNNSTSQTRKEEILEFMQVLTDGEGIW